MNSTEEAPKKPWRNCPITWVIVWVVSGTVATYGDVVSVEDIILSWIIFLLLLLFVTWIVGLIFRLAKAPVDLRRGAMLMPLVLFCIWFFSTQSFWAYPKAIFKRILEIAPPASVIDLHAYEMSGMQGSYGDIYCRIAPEDFEKIIQTHKFEMSPILPPELTQPMNFTNSLIRRIRSYPPILQPIKYAAPDEHRPRPNGFCELYTNPEHTILYVRFAVD